MRVIAATNRDLEAALHRGDFREDLFYRFNTFTITLPPLRERVEDIPVLAYHVLRKAEAKVNKKVDRISAAALDLFNRYAWPGNLRELENIVERAVVLAPGRTVEPAHLPLHVQEPGPPAIGGGERLGAAKQRFVTQFERQAILCLLADARGNVSAAARRAGTTRRNFHRLLAKYQIDSAAACEPGARRPGRRVLHHRWPGRIMSRCVCTTSSG